MPRCYVYMFVMFETQNLFVDFLQVKRAEANSGAQQRVNIVNNFFFNKVKRTTQLLQQNKIDGTDEKGSNTYLVSSVVFEMYDMNTTCVVPDTCMYNQLKAQNLPKQFVLPPNYSKKIEPSLGNNNNTVIILPLSR